MNIRARVKFRHSINAELLIQAFFSEFNRDNKIEIRGNKAKIEIFFQENPPQKIMRAISCCEVVELKYGNPIERVFENEFEWEEEPSHTELKQEEKQEGEIPKTEAESAEVEEAEVPQSEAESAEVEEAEAPKTEAESAEVEEAEAPQSEAESAEVPQPEAELAEVEEAEVPQSEAESTEDEETEKPHQSETLKKKKGRPKVVGPETVNIPYLKELAEKATSFEHFVKLVAEWLEVGKYQEFFENLEIAATQVSKMSWSELKKVLARNKVSYTESTKIKTVKCVSEKIEKYDTTLLPFLGAVALYKNHSFASEESCEEPAQNDVKLDIERDDTTEKVENALREDVRIDVYPNDEREYEQCDEVEAVDFIPVKVKMQCMPEIRSFEKALGTVDKTQPVEERVKHVLTAMGWDKKHSKEKSMVFEVVNVAVRVKEISATSVFRKVNIPDEDKMFAWMHAAKFINDFVKPYYPNVKVKVLDFLKELQEIVVLESEIEDFAN